MTHPTSTFAITEPVLIRVFPGGGILAEYKDGHSERIWPRPLLPIPKDEKAA